MRTSSCWLVLLSLLFLHACGGGNLPDPTPDPDPDPVDPTPDPDPDPDPLPWVSTQGTLWVDEAGNKLDLRGVNLGNWLAMEMWMFDMAGNIFGDDIEDQCTVEEILTDRFGAEIKNRLMEQFHDSWITEADFDIMADANMNLIRLPFLYDLIEDDSNPMTLRPDAWERIDWVIEQAKARGMYVLLDLHGTVGRQGWEHHTGCAHKNELWGNQSYRERTVWLWREIARKYKDEPTVAAYGLLNEPWGTDAITLRDFLLELYNAVREVDQNHVVVFHEHNIDGMNSWGDPYQFGVEKIAFESHKYPGVFGWGDIDYETHRDWLLCGEEGTFGVCEMQTRVEAVNAPMYIGETQTWTGFSELGGEITRGSFDRYNELGWAVTAWSYKTMSRTGGVGDGPWGMVTNAGDQLLVKADSWACDDWESTFANACSKSAKSFVPYKGEGEKTLYFTLKTGALNGTDMLWDELALTDDSTGINVLNNGDFGSDEHWTERFILDSPRNYDFTYNAGSFAGSNTGAALRITANGVNNSTLYQAVTVKGGQAYTLSGKFMDLGATGNEMWAEIYLLSEPPTEGLDIQGNVIPEITLRTSPLEDIEAFFDYIESAETIINPWVMESLQSETPAEVFTNVPNKPVNLSLTQTASGAVLNWDEVDGDVTGYHVYRSRTRNYGYTRLDSTSENLYLDTNNLGERAYYYYVTAHNTSDNSYPSNHVASGPTAFAVPSLIEAEDFSSRHPGIQVETLYTAQGGYAASHLDEGRWLEYEVNVEAAGTFPIFYNVASVPGGGRFEVIVNNQVLNTVEVPITDGWQVFAEVQQEITLPAGEFILRIQSTSGGWNLDSFTIGDVDGGIDESRLIPIDNPSVVGNGSNATAAVTTDAELAKDVVSLTVLQSNGVGQGYVSFTFDAVDLSEAEELRFSVFDTQGNNSVFISLVDSSGAIWSEWTASSGVKDTWVDRELDITEASGIDLSNVVEIRMAEWNSGTYYFSDFMFVK